MRSPGKSQQSPYLCGTLRLAPVKLPPMSEPHAEAPSLAAAPDEDLLARFETQSISHADWNHRAHVRIAYIYLKRHTFDEALNRVRGGIQKLNASHGTPEALERGYHETLTQGFMCLIDAMMTHYGACDESRAFCDMHPQVMQRLALRFFYSRPRIVSMEAKARFVTPDLAPLPIGRPAGT